jgi:TadE-like protein
MKLRWQNLRGCGGAEIAEFAVVLPILLMVIFAVYSFGRAYNIYTTITRAAQEAAQIAAVPSTCGTCPTPGAPPCGGGPATNYPGDPCVVSTVSSILTASHIDPAQIRTLAPTPPTTLPLTTNCPAPAPAPGSSTVLPPGGSGFVTVYRNVVLNPTNPQECGVIVSFQYPYTMLPMLNLGQINIPAQAETRMEY